MHRFHRRYSQPARFFVVVQALGSLAILSILLRPAAADDSLAALRGAVAAGDEQARVTAIDKLADMGPAAADAVGDLAAQLNDKSARVRAHAAYALGMIGPPARDVAPDVVKAVSDPDVHVRREAIQALETIHAGADVAAAALATALADPEPSVQVAALDALVDLGPPAVPTLAKALEDPKTRYWAALGLDEFGTAAKPALAGLIDALSDERPEVRGEVLIAIAQIGPDAASAVPKIVPLVADKNSMTACAAAFALARIGPEASAAADALRKAMTSDDELLPAVSAFALAKIEPENKAAHADATKRLLAALHRKSPRVQSAAVRGLLELKTPPDELAPELTTCITDCDRSLVPEMMGVLSAAGEAGMPALIAALARPDTRGAAAAALQHLGSKAASAVPALLGALADPDPEVRREVLYTLGAILADKGPVDPAIVKALDDPDMRVRATAAYALGRAGSAATSAVPSLRHSLESTDPTVRVVSAWALAHIAPDDPQVTVAVIPVLMHGTKSDNAMMRRGSADALGKLGKAAAQAVSALDALKKDPDESVRAAATEALEQIGAGSPEKR